MGSRELHFSHKNYRLRDLALGLPWEFEAFRFWGAAALFSVTRSFRVFEYFSASFMDFLHKEQ